MSRTSARIAVNSWRRMLARMLHAAACISPALSLWLFTYAFITLRSASYMREPTSAKHLILTSPLLAKCRGSASNRSPRLLGMFPLLIGGNGGCWTVFSRDTCNEHDWSGLIKSDCRRHRDWGWFTKFRFLSVTMEADDSILLYRD